MANEKNTAPAADDAAVVADLKKQVKDLAAENAELTKAVADLSAENALLKEAAVSATPTITLQKKSYELTAKRFLCTLKGHPLFGKFITADELAEDSDLAAWALSVGFLQAAGKEGA